MNIATDPQELAVDQQHTQSGASPVAAAAYLAGLVYLWGEALFRYVFTNYPSTPEHYMLYQARTGEIAAMWLTISVVAVAVFLLFGFRVWRSRTRVGSIPVWTIVLIISAIIAPMLGEIGTPIGI